MSRASRISADDLALASALAARLVGDRMQIDQLKRRDFITLLG
jgi:hypothetical protein